MVKEKILSIPQIDYTLFYLPNNRCTPYVAAWLYKPERDSWAQGYYFTKKLYALEYLVEKTKEKARWW